VVGDAEAECGEQTAGGVCFVDGARTRASRQEGSATSGAIWCVFLFSFPLPSSDFLFFLTFLSTHPRFHLPLPTSQANPTTRTSPTAKKKAIDPLLSSSLRQRLFLPLIFVLLCSCCNAVYFSFSFPSLLPFRRDLPSSSPTCPLVFEKTVDFPPRFSLPLCAPRRLRSACSVSPSLSGMSDKRPRRTYDVPSSPCSSSSFSSVDHTVSRPHSPTQVRPYENAWVSDSDLTSSADEQDGLESRRKGREGGGDGDEEALITGSPSSRRSVVANKVGRKKKRRRAVVVARSMSKRQVCPFLFFLVLHFSLELILASAATATAGGRHSSLDVRWRLRVGRAACGRRVRSLPHFRSAIPPF
jgi:hypothetical protein